MNTKERNNKLMAWADLALNHTKALFKDKDGSTDIPESYNGQVSAFSVAIAMSGLLPAMANYYQDNDRRKVNRCAILEVVAFMISKDESYHGNFADAKELFKHAIDRNTDVKLLQKEIIDCAIALKAVVRTYKLV